MDRGKIVTYLEEWKDKKTEESSENEANLRQVYTKCNPNKNYNESGKITESVHNVVS
jgi:hypothetical protein